MLFKIFSKGNLISELKGHYLVFLVGGKNEKKKEQEMDLLGCHSLNDWPTTISTGTERYDKANFQK